MNITITPEQLLSFDSLPALHFLGAILQRPALSFSVGEFNESARTVFRRMEVIRKAGVADFTQNRKTGRYTLVLPAKYEEQEVKHWLELFLIDNPEFKAEYPHVRPGLVNALRQSFTSISLPDFLERLAYAFQSALISEVPAARLPIWARRGLSRELPSVASEKSAMNSSGSGWDEFDRLFELGQAEECRLDTLAAVREGSK
jgi:hypothetical protein